MKQTMDIVCPHCRTKQENDLIDLVDSSDMEGKFTEECESCEKRFTVKFEFIPYLEITKI